MFWVCSGLGPWRRRRRRACPRLPNCPCIRTTLANHPLAQVNDTMAVLAQRFESLGLATPGDNNGGGPGGGAGSAGRGLRLSRLLPRTGKPVGIHKVTNYSAQVGACASYDGSANRAAESLTHERRTVRELLRSPCLSAFFLALLPTLQTINAPCPTPTCTAVGQGQAAPVGRQQPGDVAGA